MRPWTSTRVTTQLQAARTLHLEQRCATQDDELQQARERITELEAQLQTMQEALHGATEGYAIYFELYCDKCKQEVQR